MGDRFSDADVSFAKRRREAQEAGAPTRGPAAPRLPVDPETGISRLPPGAFASRPPGPPDRLGDAMGVNEESAADVPTVGDAARLARMAAAVGVKEIVVRRYAWPAFQQAAGVAPSADAATVEGVFFKRAELDRSHITGALADIDLNLARRSRKSRRGVGSVFATKAAPSATSAPKPGLRATCKACSGSGVIELTAAESSECPRCSGDGTVEL